VLLLYDAHVFVSAPEVASMRPYGHASDWWSLGILMFALLVGQVCYKQFFSNSVQYSGFPHILESPGFFRPWKVLDFPGPGKSWKISLVLESPGNESLRSWKVLENEDPG